MSIVRPCLVITGGLFVLCCLVYPGVVTAGAQLTMQERANGSLLVKDGHVIGSALLGQSLADWSAHPEYLWGRPSGASNDSATNITYSNGSQLRPTNAALLDEVKARVEILRASGVTGPIPVDLVTKSASGLDPHLSPAAVELQLPRIASARKIPVDQIRDIVRAHTEGSTLAFLGEPRVNVLLVNIDLDATAPSAPNGPRPSAAATP